MEGRKGGACLFLSTFPFLGGLKRVANSMSIAKLLCGYQRLAQNTFSLVVVGRIHDVMVS